MTNFLNHCEICNKTLKDNPNSLSLHIRTHGITKEEYYKTYIDSRTTCKCCGKHVKFINLQLGYSEYCHPCAVKIKQWGGKKGNDRKILFKEILDKRGGGSSLGGSGKRKGVKNKNPYPMTDSVISRIEKFKILDRSYNRDPEKIFKQKQTWANKTEDDLNEIMKKRDETYLYNVKNPQEITITQKTIDSLNFVFNI